MTAERPFEALRIAVLGGDEREQEIARLAAASGATVRAYGFPWPGAGIEGVSPAVSAADALDGAHYALLPIPGMAADGSLYAPCSPVPIIPDAALLSHLEAGAAIILGTADAALRGCAHTLGHRLVEYESDVELMVLRGPAIVEGALQLAIASTAVTLHASSVGVVGHGTVGRLLARTLVLLGANVHVFARNPVQRADAYATGANPHLLEELETIASGLDVLFSTVPARVVRHAALERLPPGSLVIDLAAPPGGVDIEAASALGLHAIWARGLGRRAPVTVGRSQWTGIARRILDLEERRIHES